MIRFFAIIIAIIIAIGAFALWFARETRRPQ